MSGTRALIVTVAPSVVLAGLTILSLVFVPMLGGLGALGFLGFGLLLVLRRPWALVAEMRAGWPLCLLPAWCLLSVFWSAEPGLTLRYSLQLWVTFVIAIAIGCRLSPRAFFHVVLVAYALAALASAGFGTVRADGGGWIGIFGSKNAFSTAMSMLVLAGLALALDGGRRAFARLLGLGAMGGGAVLLGLGLSAGATVATLFVGGIGAGIFLFRPLSPGQKQAAAVLCAAVALTLVVVVATQREEIMALVLQGTGKDVTLTGRTDLWAEALRQIATAPLVGQGYQAFWVQGHSVAEALWAEFDITSRSGFNFHNLYLSNAVEIGLIGVALQAMMLFAAVWLCLVWAIRAPGAETVFLAMIMLRIAVISAVEVQIYFQFDLNTVFAVAGLVFGLRAREAWRAAPAARRASRVQRPALPRSPGVLPNR